MYKNYFFLFRCIKELSAVINGKQILEAYTQEKDKLFLHIPLKDKPLFHVIISTNPQQHYITIKDEHHKAKKNTINFFEKFLPDEVSSLKIALGDRIIEFTLSNSKLNVVFRGGQSNIYLLDSENNLHPFKKVDKEERERFLQELPSLNFTDLFPLIASFIESATNESLIEKVLPFGKGWDGLLIRKLPFVGKDILKEADSRKNDFRNNLAAVVDEIVNEKIAVYYDENLGKPSFHPASFKSHPIPIGHFVFDNYFYALNMYFTLSFSESKVKDVRKEIEKFLTKTIESLTGKLNNLKGRVDAGTKEKIYHQFGDLLLANINLLRKGMKDIELKLSPHQNVDRYYDKSRAEKIEFQRSSELLELNAKEYERLIKIRDKFERTEDQEELLQIKKELKMKQQSAQTDDKKDKMLYRHFLIDSKYNIYVGKDSKNNDMLTTKFAKQNDFWFHARSVSGSHVVLRVENTKETVPKNILHKTASVAAFYSKAKTSKLVPVTYTLKKYVVKNARHEPGQVTVTKEKVLLVKPEIPNGCEMVTD